MECRDHEDNVSEAFYLDTSGNPGAATPPNLGTAAGQPTTRPGYGGWTADYETRLDWRSEWSMALAVPGKELACPGRTSDKAKELQMRTCKGLL
ncbi:hypothetical protein PR001_g6764 [Phytophthora rubi]|uniref:Uncharacterized protein n=1 Tax=Phytophthora rubi TaxID=129364 RepID=A0A6A3NJB5_9STRA|nr:hypothetical protein PR001_g6764 [Phytophthora rubi]